MKFCRWLLNLYAYGFKNDRKKHLSQHVGLNIWLRMLSVLFLCLDRLSYRVKEVKSICSITYRNIILLNFFMNNLKHLSSNWYFYRYFFLLVTRVPTFSILLSCNAYASLALNCINLMLDDWVSSVMIFMLGKNLQSRDSWMRVKQL